MTKKWLLASFLVLGTALSACSAGRDVEVEGEVSSASTQGDILVQFWDIQESERAQVHDIKLAAPGTFKETVPLEGERLLVRAIADADGNGACTAGEQWAELELPIADDGSVEPVKLVLGGGACPTN